MLRHLARRIAAPPRGARCGGAAPSTVAWAGSPLARSLATRPPGPVGSDDKPKAFFEDDDAELLREASLPRRRRDREGLETDDPPVERMAAVRNLASLLSPHVLSISAALGCLVVSSASMMTVPYGIGRVVDITARAAGGTGGRGAGAAAGPAMPALQSQQSQQYGSDAASEGGSPLAGLVDFVRAKMPGLGEAEGTSSARAGAADSAADGAASLPLSDAIEGALAASAVTEVIGLAQWLVPVFLLGSIANFGRIVLLAITGEGIVLNVRRRLYKTMMRQDAEFFDRTSTGALTSQISVDTLLVGKILTDNIARGGKSVVQGFGSLGMMLSISPHLTAVMVACVLPITVGAAFYGKRVSSLSRSIQDTVADLNSLSHERLSGRITVRANSRVDDEVHRFSRRARQVFLLARRQAILSGVFFASFPFLGNVGLLAVMASGAGLVSSGAMTAGGLTSFLTYGIWLGISMKNGSEFWSDLQRSTGASARLFATLGSEPRLLPGPRPADIRGEIEFRDVTFAFPTRPQAPILSGFNLKVRAGTVVALVGESGSGKSTCAALISRLYDPQNGQVLIDGVPLMEYDTEAYLRRVAWVQQEPTLFDGTIADNIAYGDLTSSALATPAASQLQQLTVQQPSEAVLEAARIANCHEFVSSFARGYDTPVGERGSALSGGQRQRVAIARALAKQPSILVLDEATSALDSQSEHLVQTALQSLFSAARGSLTVVVVAHRLSTVRGADAIAVLENGRVAEMGTYSELVKNNGAFSRLVRRQSLAGCEDEE